MKKSLSIASLFLISLNAIAYDQVLFEGTRNDNGLKCLITKTNTSAGEVIEGEVETTEIELSKINFKNLGQFSYGPFENGTVDRILKGEKLSIENESDNLKQGIKISSGPIFSNSNSVFLWSNNQNDDDFKRIAKFNQIAFELKENQVTRVNFNQSSQGAGPLGLIKKVNFYCSKIK